MTGTPAGGPDTGDAAIPAAPYDPPAPRGDPAPRDPVPREEAAREVPTAAPVPESAPAPRLPVSTPAADGNAKYVVWSAPPAPAPVDVPRNSPEER